MSSSNHGMTARRARTRRNRGRGGTAGVASADEDPHVRMCRCVHEIEVVLALALPGWKGFPGGDASVHGGRRSGELGSGRLKVSLWPTRKACACAWVHDGCACA